MEESQIECLDGLKARTYSSPSSCKNVSEILKETSSQKKDSIDSVSTTDTCESPKSSADKNKNEYEGLENNHAKKPEIPEDFQHLFLIKRKNTFDTLRDESNYELNFFRDSEEIRNSYISKLLIHGLLNNKDFQKKNHNALIIFDWDDTLLCTSFLTPNGYYDENMVLSEKDQAKLQRLEKSVYKMLEISTSKGETFIITNAEPGWVEFSAGKYFPSILRLLEKIHVISARGLYEKQFPDMNYMWKIKAFNDIFQYFDDNLLTNIICVGDSFNEIEAGKNLASRFSNAYIKTIKFKQYPKIDDIRMQLDLVVSKFDYIFSAGKNWSITVEKKLDKRDKSKKKRNSMKV